MYRILTITLSSLFLFACGGDDSSSDETTTPVAAFNLTSATDGSAGKITFEWDGDNTGLTYTVCEKDVTADNNCSALESVTGVNSVDVHIDSLLGRISSEFFILASNGSSTASTNELTLSSDNITHLIRYLKASNSEEGDEFSQSLSLSSDGYTLAVGSAIEASNSTGINGDEADNSIEGAGAVYLFRYDGTDWSQQAYIKPENLDDGGKFGQSVSLSADGNTLAVGSQGEDSDTTGINSQSNDDANSAGAVYIFQYDGTDWSQQAYIKASNTSAGDNFGVVVSLNSDGDLLAVSATKEDSKATGIYNDIASISDQDIQDNSSKTSSGAVYVFRSSADVWVQDAYIKASNTDSRDSFGSSLSLSGDGSTLVVGADSEDSDATGVYHSNDAGSDLAQDDDSASSAGAVYVFRYNNSAWTQQAYIKASNAAKSDKFGDSVSLSEDGNTLAVGANQEESNGIDGQDDNSVPDSGAVYIFEFNDSIWTQQAYIKASKPAEDDSFGNSVSLNSSGNLLVVGAAGESSSATGLNGDETADSTELEMGAVYQFKYDGAEWVQQAYIKASDTAFPGRTDTTEFGDPDKAYGDGFGNLVALSGDGKTLVVGSKGEDSNATGVDGAANDDSVKNSGAIYIY